MMKPPKGMHEYLATIGKKGGTSTTLKKSKASKANLKKARAARWPQKGGSA